MILIKSKNLDYWKKKLLAVLKGDVLEKSLEEILYPGIMLKSLPKETLELLIKARGFAPGTIRTWSGKEYKKLSSGKWMRTYTGTGERGERQAIRNVMKAIQGASSMEELSEIINKNMQRFKGKDGKTLPVVKEFMTAARGTEKGKKPEKELTYQEKDKQALDKVKDEILPKLENIKLGRSSNSVDFTYGKENYVLSPKGVLGLATKKDGKTWYSYGGDLNSELSSREQTQLKELFTDKYDRDKKKNIYKIPEGVSKNKQPDKPIDKKPTKIIVKKPVNKILKFQSTTGKTVNLKVDGDKIMVNVKGVFDGEVVSTGGAVSFRPPKGKRSMSLKVNQDGKVGYISIVPEKLKEVDSFLSDFTEKKKSKEKENLNTKIPGHDELKQAYEKRSHEMDLSDKYMQKLYDTSVGSGKQGDPAGAEKEVNRLEEKYPKAKMYISYVDANPASSSGYQRRKAARALLEGKTIEEAKKIANDYDFFD